MATRQNIQQRPQSLEIKLNSRLFFRLLFMFFCLDIVLSILALTGSFLWGETRAAGVAELVEERGVPSQEAIQWMQAVDYSITPLEQMPELSRQWDLLKYYQVNFPNSGEPYSVTIDMTGLGAFLRWGAVIILSAEGIILICNLFSNAGIIRKTLRPIQELAATAKRLNSMTHMSRQQLEDLAGELEKINATHLDNRIDLPGTQKELRALAQAINAMLDRINEAYRSQMRFVSDASHELRTPIAVIQGYANLLNRWGKDDPATRQEAIDAIRQEADSMKELVEQLLFLARGDNDSMHIEMETFDLTEVAAEVLKETGMIDQTHTFSARWEGAVPVCADVGLTKQALRILVDNSIKYTPAGGHITLSAALRDGMARLSVQDEGQGIDAGSLPHVFDRFYRTDQSRARQTGGTGLGLAIAKWIVDRHGGWFEVRSWPGVGTRMTIVLPVAELDAGGADEDAEQTRPA